MFPRFLWDETSATTLKQANWTNNMGLGLIPRTKMSLVHHTTQSTANMSPMRLRNVPVPSRCSSIYVLLTIIAHAMLAFKSSAGVTLGGESGDDRKRWQCHSKYKKGLSVPLQMSNIFQNNEKDLITGRNRHCWKKPSLLEIPSTIGLRHLCPWHRQWFWYWKFKRILSFIFWCWCVR